MSEPIDKVAQRMIDHIDSLDPESDDASQAVKSLKTYAEAKKLLEPEPTPVPEPTGIKAFFVRNSGDLIKGGVTLTAVTVIAVLEAKGDLIFRSKATKYL